MLFCLDMDADIAAAHRHAFSPLPKSTDQNKNQFCHSLPYFSPSYSTSHTSVASSSSSASASERSDGSAGSRKLGMLEGRHEYEASTKATSSIGCASDTKSRKRSASKNKTSFQLAHPPPAVKHRQRFSIRPRLLLQLQQTSDSTRAVPVLDVLPSITFAPRLAQKFPRIFKGKDGLGADDLVIVRSQTYERPGAPERRIEKSSDDDGWNNRDFVAAICQVREGEGAALGNTEICLNHGLCWEATATAPGAYEFTSTDEKGKRTVVRWVPKPLPGRRRSMKTQERSGTSSGHGVEKFNFSIINPDSRRHPVIATLTRQSLSICDRYSISTTPTFAQASASQSGSPITDVDTPDLGCDDLNDPPSTTMKTGEHLRTLIVITGLWVAFREGYSPNFRYSDPIFSSVAEARTQQQAQKSYPRRSLSINLGNIASGRAGNSDGGRQQKRSQFRPEIASSFSASAVSTLESPTSAQTRPRRTLSAGTAFMNRVNTRSSSSAVKSSAQNPVSIPSPVPSYEEMDCEDHPSQAEERTFRVESPTAFFKPRQRRVTMGVKMNSGYRSSVATISDMQSSEYSSAPMDTNGGKARRLNKLFGFLRRTSGAHA